MFSYKGWLFAFTNINNISARALLMGAALGSLNIKCGGHSMA